MTRNFILKEETKLYIYVICIPKNNHNTKFSICKTQDKTTKSKVAGIFVLEPPEEAEPLVTTEEACTLHYHLHLENASQPGIK